jgi:hypothetical protein
MAGAPARKKAAAKHAVIDESVPVMGAVKSGRRRKDAGTSHATVAGKRATRKTAKVTREMSDDDRLRLFQASFHQSVLPDIPSIPGYHICWLTASNPRDTIQMRARWGYVPITKDDVPGYDFVTVKTGDHAGCIMVNEMIAYKLPIELYQRYMQESHHDAPEREEQKLADTAASIREHAASVNPEARRVGYASGTEAIGDPKRKPRSKFHELRE